MMIHICYFQLSGHMHLSFKLDKSASLIGAFGHEVITALTCIASA